MDGPSVVGVPGRERDLDGLLTSATGAARGDGRVVFVAGDPGSGREELLHALARELDRARRGPLVVAGRFVDGNYVAWDDDQGTAAKSVATLKTLGQVGERIARWLAQTGVPFAPLVSQLLAMGGLPLDALDRLIARGEAEPFDLSARALRRLCEMGPVVCIVDDAHRAENGGLWADLILNLGRRIALDLPLVLILGVEGPEQLGAHEDDEPDSLNVARTLTADATATWHALRPVEHEALVAWTGPLAADVSKSLLAITEGRAAWTAELWHDWKRRGIVEDVTRKRWCFAPGRERLLDEGEDLLEDRLTRFIGRDDLVTLAHAVRVLACAALVDRRFAPAAVADALQLDPDETIDFLDERLVVDRERPDGLVVDDGWIEVQDESGHRHVARYRFAHELVWLTLRHQGLGAPDRRALAGPLADAISRRFGRESHRVAYTLARLYALAGQADRARHFQRLADNGVRTDVILWRARAVLAGPDPEARAERLRASHVLLAAANQLYHSGPFGEGLAFAQAAERLSPSSSAVAEAVRVAGVHHKHLGHPTEAREHFERARDLYRQLDNRRGEANATNSIAVLDIAEDEYERAHDQFVALLEVWRELGEPVYENSTLGHLARLEFHQGRLPSAYALMIDVIERWRELGRRREEAMARGWLAEILTAMGKREEARAELASVLAIDREERNANSEATTLAIMAQVAMDEQDEEETSGLLRQALRLFRAQSNKSGEASVRFELARLMLRQGRHEETERELRELLPIERELRNRAGEAAVLHGLAQLDFSNGRYDLAGRGFEAAARLRSEMGRTHREANSRFMLAAVHRRLGDEAQARVELAHVAEIRHAIGDLTGEQIARAALRELDDSPGA